MERTSSPSTACDEVSGKLTGAEIEGAIREFVIQHMFELLVVPGSTPIQKMKTENLEHVLRDVRPLLSTPGTLEEFRRFEAKQHSKPQRDDDLIIKIFPSFSCLSLSSADLFLMPYLHSFY